MTTVLLALAASAIIGVSDYLGGRASERMHPMLVALGAQGSYLVIGPAVALVVGSSGVTAVDVRWGLLAGVLSGSAYLLFFRALSTGRMGVAAPITAAMSAAVPVLFDVIDGVDLRAGRWWGLAIALVAVPVVAYTPSAPDDHVDGSGRPSTLSVVAMAGGAGALFAGFFLCIGQTSADSGQWPFAASAITSTSTIAIACTVGVSLRRLAWAVPSRQAVASGVTGALAGACITAALQRGPVGVATVLGSLFPLVTVALAATLARERVRWWHASGLALAVVGASLVAVYR